MPVNSNISGCINWFIHDNILDRTWVPFQTTRGKEVTNQIWFGMTPPNGDDRALDAVVRDVFHPLIGSGSNIGVTNFQ